MKKLLKQLLAVTTAIMMAITLLPAMANAEATIDYTKKGSITINKTTGNKDEGLNGAKFALYKIADFTNGFNEEDNLLVQIPNKTTKVKDLLDLSESDQKKVASAFATVVPDKNKVDEKTTETVNGKDGVAVFGKDNNENTLDAGYYLVVETDTPQGYVASTPFFVAIPQANNTSKFGEENNTAATGWDYDITATPKNQKVTIGKKITNITDKGTIVNGQKATVKVGDEVGYTITSISPQYTDEYFNYDKETEADKLPVYKITDTLSSGLQYVADSLEVKIAGKENPLIQGKNQGEKNDYTLELVPNKNQIIITFTQDFLQNKDYKGKEVTVTYKAKVLPSAAVTNPNTNEVELSYTNKPGSETQGVKSKDIPELYTYGLKVYKKDSNGAKLTGAKFKLYKVENKGTDNAQKKQIKGLDRMNNEGVMTAKQDNEFIFSGLDVGDYELEEVESPKGYTLLTDTIKFSIGDTQPDGKLDSATGAEIETNTGYAKINVTNKKGFNLPSTGGMGTYIFTIGGLVVMAGAVLLLVSSKKKRA